MARVGILIGRALAAYPKSAARGLTESLPALPETGGWEQAVYDLHVALVITLQAHDTALFYAYDLGRSLADTCRAPEELGPLMDPARARPPAADRRPARGPEQPPAPHAAAAVAATLEQWKGWTAEARARENMEGVRGAMARQGALWRALLTGEKGDRDARSRDGGRGLGASRQPAGNHDSWSGGCVSAGRGLLVLVTALLLYVILEGSGSRPSSPRSGRWPRADRDPQGAGADREETIGELRGGSGGPRSMPPSPTRSCAYRRPLPPPSVRSEPRQAGQRGRAAHHHPAGGAGTARDTSAKQQGIRVPAAGPGRRHPAAGRRGQRQRQPRRLSSARADFMQRLTYTAFLGVRRNARSAAIGMRRWSPDDPCRSAANLMGVVVPFAGGAGGRRAAVESRRRRRRPGDLGGHVPDRPPSG